MFITAIIISSWRINRRKNTFNQLLLCKKLKRSLQHKPYCTLYHYTFNILAVFSSAVTNVTLLHCNARKTNPPIQNVPFLLQLKYVLPHLCTSGWFEQWGKLWNLPTQLKNSLETKKVAFQYYSFMILTLEIFFSADI